MTGNPRVFGLLEEMLDSGKTPEEVCRDCPELLPEVRERWPINRVGIVHRLGRIEISESSVVICVTSAHRKPAFEACQYAIDRLKKIVPIWKKEYFEDGAIWVEGETGAGGGG